MAAAMTGGNDISLRPGNIRKKMRDFQQVLFEIETGTLRHCDEKLFLSQAVQRHVKDRIRHGNAPEVFPRHNHNGEVVVEAVFVFLLHMVVFIVSLED